MNLSLVTMYLTSLAYPVRFIFTKQADNEIVIYIFFHFEYQNEHDFISTDMYTDTCFILRRSVAQKMSVELIAVTRVLKAHCSEAQKMSVKFIAHTM